MHRRAFIDFCAFSCKNKASGVFLFDCLAYYAIEAKRFFPKWVINNQAQRQCIE